MYNDAGAPGARGRDKTKPAGAWAPAGRVGMLLPRYGVEVTAALAGVSVAAGAAAGVSVAAGAAGVPVAAGAAAGVSVAAGGVIRPAGAVAPGGGVGVSVAVGAMTTVAGSGVGVGGITGGVCSQVFSGSTSVFGMR